LGSPLAKSVRSEATKSKDEGSVAVEKVVAANDTTTPLSLRDVAAQLVRAEREASERRAETTGIEDARLVLGDEVLALDSLIVLPILRAVVGRPRGGMKFDPEYHLGLDLARRVLEATAAGEWDWIAARWNDIAGRPTDLVRIRQTVADARDAYLGVFAKIRGGKKLYPGDGDSEASEAAVSKSLLQRWGAVGGPYAHWRSPRALCVRQLIVRLSHVRPEFAALDPIIVDSQLRRPRNVGADSIAVTLWNRTFTGDRRTKDAFKKQRARAGKSAKRS